MIFPEDTEQDSHPAGADVPVWAVVAMVSAGCWLLAGVVVLILTIN